MVALIVLLFLALTLSIDSALRAYRRRRGIDWEPGPRRVPLPDWALLPRAAWDVPVGVFHSAGHAWAQLQPGGTLRIGADAFLHEAVGPADKIKVRPEGTSVWPGAPIAQLSQNDRTIWLRSPVAGVIRSAQNGHDAVAHWSDAYGKGWLAEVETEDPADALRSMHMGKRMREWLRAEAWRFGQFLVLSPSGSMATLQDGGYPVKKRLAALTAERAHEMQRRFFDITEGR